MATEIERKFLVAGEGWRHAALGPGLPYRQGYLPNGGGPDAPVVRVRLAGEAGVLTIKGPGLTVRAEYEYPIPAADAAAMLATLCVPPVLEKTRTRVAHAGLIWEVDEFAGHGELPDRPAGVGGQAVEGAAGVLVHAVAEHQQAAADRR